MKPTPIQILASAQAVIAIAKSNGGRVPSGKAFAILRASAERYSASTALLRAAGLIFASKSMIILTEKGKAL